MNSEDSITFRNDKNDRGKNIRVWDIVITDPLTGKQHINELLERYKMNTKTHTIDELLEELRQSAAKQYHEHHNLNVKFKKLHDDAVLPTYAHIGDAGLDCYAVSDADVNDTYIGYKLGFAVEIPNGYVGLLFPRSSNSKKDLLLSNSVGVVDSIFRGEVQARFRDVNLDQHNALGEPTKLYNKGDAVCQLIVIPYPTIDSVWADDLSDTVRGEDCFGSTDN